MDDPTKDLIPRNAIEYCLRKETVSTNPDEYEAHEKFIAFMDDPEISEFGKWMHSNGFNCALTTVKCDLDKIPATQPEQRWVLCTPVNDSYLPDLKDKYMMILVTYRTGRAMVRKVKACLCNYGYLEKKVPGIITAYMPFPEPFREEGDT